MRTNARRPEAILNIGTPAETPSRSLLNEVRVAPEVTSRYEENLLSLDGEIPAGGDVVSLTCPPAPGVSARSVLREFLITILLRRGNLHIGILDGSRTSYLVARCAKPGQKTEIVQLLVPANLIAGPLVFRALGGSQRVSLDLCGIEYRLIETGGLIPIPSLDPVFAIPQNRAELLVQGDAISIRTPAAEWMYAAALIPLWRWHQLSSDALIEIEISATVESGSLGFGVLSADSETFIDEVSLTASPQPQTAVISLGTDARFTHAMLRNTRIGTGITVAHIHAIDCRVVTDHPAALERDLYAFYDLNYYPMTFDIIPFLISAEIVRRERGLGSLHLVFVPGAMEGERYFDLRYDDAVPKSARRWRLANVLYDSLQLAPFVAGFSVASQRRDGILLRSQARHVYTLPLKDGQISNRPHLQDIYCHVTDHLHRWPEHHRLSAPEEALHHVDQWLEANAGGAKPITITIRRYAHHPERNSNLEDWVSFAQQLDKAIYVPIFVMDTAVALERLPPIDGFLQFREAAFNLGLRMALYERAYLNLFTNSGPTMLAWFNERVRYIYYKILVNDTSIHDATEIVCATYGWKPGETPRFAAPFQKWVWEDDELPVIQREFAAMVNRIELADSA
jgi:hypothetical protein